MSVLFAQRIRYKKAYKQTKRKKSSIQIMKTKNLTPREAMELLLLTGKPLPSKTTGNYTSPDHYLTAVSIDDEDNPFFVISDYGGFWTPSFEIEIPEGRNHDEKTYGSPSIVRTYNGESAVSLGLTNSTVVLRWREYRWFMCSFNGLFKGDRWMLQPPPPKE
jgi:hypothetical protein